MVMFTHCCPFCQRKRRMEIQNLGQEVKCVQCGRTSAAVDPHNESLAMMDSIKVHAELAIPDEGMTDRIRAPR